MDDDGFDAFYRATYRRVVIALRLATGTTEAAEDVAQEAFARTLARWPRVRRGSNPAGYVYRVAFRLHQRSAVRRRRQQEAATAAQVQVQLQRTTAGPGPADSWGTALAAREAFARLPPACRRAAALCLYAELTAEEAAAVLGVRASTVRTQVQRARAALTAALASGDEEPAPAR